MGEYSRYRGWLQGVPDGFFRRLFPTLAELPVSSAMRSAGNEELHEIRLGGKPFRASRLLGRLAEKSTRRRVLVLIFSTNFSSTLLNLWLDDPFATVNWKEARWSTCGLYCRWYRECR